MLYLNIEFNWIYELHSYWSYIVWILNLPMFLIIDTYSENNYIKYSEQVNCPKKCKLKKKIIIVKLIAVYLESIKQTN